ncbi:uncharacterized protein LOC133390587 isoform X2 [Rhineura floridana]|uniref:uncharacterized protein LOC133390587 isoform X2 n=1 Tax=Rhineura floridana TaxID=261503 RepID=UPI002AC8127B|nr:uncharacterized protein LOC133390587 isoform X2 [Rhineura floridana]
MWLHGRLVEEVKVKKSMYKEWKEGRITKEEYRRAARACRNSVRKAKTQNELRLAREARNNKKGFFRYVRSKRKTKETVGLLLSEDGKMLTDNEEKAELLNTYFASVFSQKGNSVQPCNSSNLRKGSGLQFEIDKEIVRKYLVNLNEFKSPGPDELHPRVLKELADVLSEPLAIIFEKSWRTGEVPEDWRQLVGKPYSKSGRWWLCFGLEGDLHRESTLDAAGSYKFIEFLICRQLPCGQGCFHPLSSRTQEKEEKIATMIVSIGSALKE